MKQYSNETYRHFRNLYVVKHIAFSETYCLQNKSPTTSLIPSKTTNVLFDETVAMSRLRAARGVSTVSGEIYISGSHQR